MGLDLVVEGRARPGHDAEWRRLLRRSFAEEDLNAAEQARFAEISIPPHEGLGAPRVGFDPAADAWIIAARRAETPDAAAAVLRDFHGHHVLALVAGDGVPAHSNGGLYDGLDETSFRGVVLKGCADILGKPLLDDAWNSKLPEAAVAYGRALLAAAEATDPPARAGRGWLARLGLARTVTPLPLAEQREIVRAAGRWFIFWGQRGHPIRAWF